MLCSIQVSFVCTGFVLCTIPYRTCVFHYFYAKTGKKCQLLSIHKNTDVINMVDAVPT